MADRHTAARLPRDPGKAGWLEILGAVQSYPALEKDITADWVVIGGGFAGLTAAKRLTQHTAGSQIVMLDATSIAAGPAGRNSGFMIDLPHDLGGDSYISSLEKDRREIRFNRHAQEFVRGIAAEYGMPEEAVNPCGRINGAVNTNGEKHNTEYADHLKNLGEDHRMLNAAEMEAVTGSAFYSSGLFMPGTIMLQPALYISMFAEGLNRSAGNALSIYENTPALSFDREGTGWRVRTPKGVIRCGGIILAVNGHAESFGFYKNRLMHVFTYASMTEPLDGRNAPSGDRVWGVTPSDPMGTTIRRVSGIGGDRIIVRNRWTFDATMEIPAGRLDQFARTHRASFDKRYPGLGDVKFDYTWGGRLCMSRNAVAAFGEVERNVFSACCQNGLGTAKGTLAGMAAADLACGVQSEIVDHLSASDAPQKLPPQPFRSIGANAVIKFREFKALKEL